LALRDLAVEIIARILGAASAGEEIVITRRGKPAAVLAPYRPQALTSEQKAAVARIREMMQRAIGRGARRFARDEIYEL
jgi:prevent-host-death family protein